MVVSLSVAGITGWVTGPRGPETTKTTSKSFKQSFNIYRKHTKEGEIVKKVRKTK
jgi:hypothetical protein